MGTKEIMLICAGGLFLALFIAYIVFAVRRNARRKEEKIHLGSAYSDGEIAKMEYDIAFYDVDMFDVSAKEIAHHQMSIDDIETMPDRQDDEKNAAQDAILTRVDDEGVEEITGNYRPEEEN